MSASCLRLITFLDLPPRAVPTTSRDACRIESDRVLGKQSRITSPRPPEQCRPPANHAPSHPSSRD